MTGFNELNDQQKAAVLCSYLIRFPYKEIDSFDKTLEDFRKYRMISKEELMKHYGNGQV